MTISTTTSTVTYQGNGATTAWNFSFVGDSSSYIQVYLTTAAGITTGPLPGGQYGIVLNSAPVGGLWGIGGTVTYPLSGSPLATGTYISIVREVPYTQSVSINNQGNFYPQAVEQALDVLELQIQQLENNLLYTIQAPITDPTVLNVLPSWELRANGLLVFDLNGQPYITPWPAPSVSPIPGAYAVTRKISTTGTATIPVLSTDSFGGVSIYQSSTPVTTLQLPTGGYGPFPIFDAGGNAGTYPITVLPQAGKTINGQTSATLSYNYQSLTIYWDGSEYFIG